MAFDDDDDAARAGLAPTAPTAEQALETAEEDIEDEAQDFRHFLALQRKNFSSQEIRKGEKDYENYGIQSQSSALEASRSAMETVLSYTRLHNSGKDWIRGWYFPDRWATAGEEGQEYLSEVEKEGKEVDEKQAKIAREKAAERREIHTRDRVVCVSLQHHTLGRSVRGQGTTVPGWDQVWLLPEEALFWLERGTMDLWWPTASIAEIFPVRREDDPDGEDLARRLKELKEVEEKDEYALGFPLSLQAAYSLLVGKEGERGRTTLQKLQVFSNLNRAGFNVIRVPPPDCIPHTTTSVASPTQPIWQRLMSLLFFERPLNQPPYGPLVQPGLYRSYASIYRRLAVIPRHKPIPHDPAHPCTTAHSPFRIQYHLWKPGTPKWSKTKPPTAPDYYLAIVDAQETCTPTTEEITTLLASAPYAPPPKTSKGQTTHQRLKHGHRNVLVAVVDHGVVNYIRFAEAAFGEEDL
ncbi:tRNA-splicing endonuclease subunit sen54, partial [Gnomoniopsis sp. IMI 355080]